MSKILVYGDSFGAPSYPEQNDWPGRLGLKMNIPVINKAVSGGNTDNAMKHLINDHLYGQIQNGDIIIFVKSTPGRLSFKFQRERPETASLYLHDLPSLLPNEAKDKKHDWYYENRKFIEWWQINFDYDRECVIHEGYTHMIKNISEFYPKSPFLVYANSLYYPDVPIKTKKKSNFFELDNISLFQLSKNEIISDVPDAEKYTDWIKYTGFDMRDNHLSQINLEILTNLTHEVIEKRTTENFTMDKFQQNLLKPIKTVNEYRYYVESGLLPYADWKEEVCKKISSFSIFG